MRISDWSSDVCSSDLLFVSALRPGQGLWPDDKWPDRKPLFEDDPDTDELDDFNPNRIFTSKRMKPGEYFYDIKLDNGKSVLTEGFQEIGRKLWRARVCQYVMIVVDADSMSKIYQ